MRESWLVVCIAGFCGAAYGQGRCAAVPDGLSAWFTFEEPLPQKKGPQSPQVIPGMVGKALRFDGKGQYLEIPAQTAGVEVGESSFTIELWMRTSDAGSVRNVVDKRSTTPIGYAIYIAQGHVGFQIANGDHNNVTATRKEIADNRWHHVAGVARRLPPDFWRIYVDGEQAAVSSIHTPLTNLRVAEPLWLARHHPNGRVNRDDLYYAGDIDELTFYRRALGAAEIRAIYQAGTKGKCPGLRR